MDIQAILLVILILLTINLIVVGIYIVSVVRDFKKTVNKMNHVLDTVQNVTDKVSFPMISLSSLAAGVSSGLKIFDSIKSLKKNKSDSDDEEE